MGDVPYHKFKLVHSRFRAHTIEDERAARWIYKFARYRFDVFYGSAQTLKSFLTIANCLKGAGVKLSKDESVFDSSSVKGHRNLILSRGKNHDYGRMVRRLCGSARGCEDIGEDITSTAENRKWVGAGNTHSAELEAGKNYYQHSPYEVHGKGYGLMFSLLTKNVFFLGKGHEVYVDSYFLRKPICTLEHAKFALTNVSGTVRKDASNLPDKQVRESMRSEVANLPKGGYQSMVNEEHKIGYFVLRSRAVCEMASNWHPDEMVSSIRRYDAESKEFQDLDTSVVMVDHNKGGFLNCDAADAATYTASPMKRRTCHSWRTDLEIPIYRMATVNSWILWRSLHPGLKTTHRDFLMQIAKKRINCKFLVHNRKRSLEPESQFNPRGRKRFTKLPISQLSPAQIRFEMGPRQLMNYNPEIVEYAETMIVRAKTCMYFHPTFWKKRNQCCVCKRRASTHYRCIGCGALACFKESPGEGEKTHLQKMA